MDLLAERSVPTPLSHSPLLPLLLLSVARQRHTPHTSSEIKNEYDFIIVGGGSAGSVVASRLSEEPTAKVLLLEAGLKPPFITEVPGLSRYLLYPDVMWNFKTIPQKYVASGLINKQLVWPSGKILGGSGMVNGMAYVRGNRYDYDNWAAQGAKGWTYRDVFPYFLKLEDFRNIALLANGYHATGGPITVEQPRYQFELKQAVFEAVPELGYELVDSNAAKQTGFFDFQMNIRDNQRCSTVKGYLVPAEFRTNLDIFLNSTVIKIIIEGDRATGVEFYSDGVFRTVKAKREVIVSGGIVNTPQLLMLSGIGPRDELQKLGIPVFADLPVGKNLQDQLSIIYPFTMEPPFANIDDKLADPSNIFQYINSRSGPLAGTSLLLTAFLKVHHSELSATRPADPPDYQLYFQEPSKSLAKYFGLKPEVYEQFYAPYENQTYFTCSVQQLKPKSRGTVTLKSRNPFDPPLIDPNYLEHPEDIEVLVEGLKMCKKILNTGPLVKLGAKPFKTLVPGCELQADYDDDYFNCYIRAIPNTFFHYAGSCKMGDPADSSTVVDPELRVKNIKGLRVVDASIMPQITSGNTQTPTIMIAEKASDMIKSSMSAEIVSPSSKREKYEDIISKITQYFHQYGVEI